MAGRSRFAEHPDGRGTARADRGGGDPGQGQHGGGGDPGQVRPRDGQRRDGVTGGELVVGDGFRGHQDRIRSGGQGGHQLGGGAAGEVAVLQGGHRRDGGRVHPVQVLQVGADVGEPVQQRFHRAHPGHDGERGGGVRGHGGGGGFGDGDVGAVAQLRVGLGLLRVGGVEGGGGRR